MKPRPKPPLPPGITYGRKYDIAMRVNTQEEADAYFERCVLHTMQFGKTREEAEKIERDNLGYWAGYFDNDTRARVEKLFKCEHPYFGSIAEKGPPTMEEALKIGIEAGKKLRVNEEGRR